jgi:hypothetical protein
MPQKRGSLLASAGTSAKTRLLSALRRRAGPTMCRPCCCDRRLQVQRARRQRLRRSSETIQSKPWLEDKGYLDSFNLSSVLPTKLTADNLCIVVSGTRVDHEPLASKAQLLRDNPTIAPARYTGRRDREAWRRSPSTQPEARRAGVLIPFK